MDEAAFILSRIWFCRLVGESTLSMTEEPNDAGPADPSRKPDTYLPFGLKAVGVEAVESSDDEGT